MLKAVILLRKRVGMSHEDFSMRFRVHARPLIQSLPGVERIVVSEPVAAPGGRPAYDGMAEFWLADLDAVRRLIESEQARQIESKMSEFIDMDSYETFLTVEHEVEVTPATAQ